MSTGNPHERQEQKRTGRFSTEMFYSEAMEFLNDLENIRKARASKYPSLVEFLEAKLPKGAVKKASFQTVTIREIFLKHMKIFSVGSERNPLT